MKKVIPIVIMSALLFVVCPICEASIMSRLCSSFANVLDNEETKSAAAVKNCKKNCALIQKKHGLIKAAQKKVDDSCAKNIAPDITKVSAGLDKNVQAKLRKQYNQLSKMYDGTKDLPIKDFGLTTKSNQSPVLGKGGRVTDLKTSDPDINKTPTEFSLSGTKLSGETPGQATTKQSPVLLASASSAKSPADTAAAAKTAGLTQKAEAASENTLPICSEGATICAGGGGLSCQKPCQSPSNPEAPGWLMSCVSGDDCVGGETGDECPPGQVRTGWLFWKKCVPACGGKEYNPNKECCVNGKKVKKCGGECYNPETECCKDGKKYEKCEGECYNPKKECCKEGTKYTDKIKTLDECPSRYQKTAPTWNGCGGKWSHYIVRDNPTRGRHTSFREPCNEHDRDYDRCKSDAKQTDEIYKAAADTKYLNSMYAICDSTNVLNTEWSRCRENAGKYQNMVDPGIINDSYRDAQLKSCKCCPRGAL